MLKYRFFTVQTRGSEEIWLKVCGKFCVITERRSRTSWVPPQGVKVSVSQTPQHNTSTNAWLCLRCRERENTRRCLKPVLSHPGGGGVWGGGAPPGSGLSRVWRWQWETLSRPVPSPPGGAPARPSGRPASSCAGWTDPRSLPGSPQQLERQRGRETEREDR